MLKNHTHESTNYFNHLKAFKRIKSGCKYSNSDVIWYVLVRTSHSLYREHFGIVHRKSTRISKQWNASASSLYKIRIRENHQ